jgi:catalase
MLASLVNVSVDLAAAVAAGLGMDTPKGLPKALAKAAAPEVKVSPALSLTALPGECGIRTRQIAILIGDGVHGASLATLLAAISEAGAVAHFVGPRVGAFTTFEGGEVEAGKSMENSPSVLFDALVLPDGEKAIETLTRHGHTMEYLKDQFRHCKTILALGASRQLLEKAGIPASKGQDPGILVAEPGKAAKVATAFIAAIARHRHPSRDSYPPGLPGTQTQHRIAAQR